MSSLSDEDLVAKYRESGGKPNGTPFADELFQRHYSRVALWCFRIAGDREVATDLAQEVFTKAWLHLDHFRADSKFTTWLFTIARNHCFNFIRTRERSSETAFDVDVLDGLGAQLAGFDLALERAQLAETARDIMAKELTPTESQAMTLHFGEGLSLSTVSRMLRLDNPSGAKAYIVSARRKLKAALERWAARAARSVAEGNPRNEG